MATTHPEDRNDIYERALASIPGGVNSNGENERAVTLRRAARGFAQLRAALDEGEA
jgi:hypothetical protein